LRLALLAGDVLDDVLVQTAGRGGTRLVGVGPTEVVAADPLQLGVQFFDGGHELTALSTWLLLDGLCGMQVVQTPSPWAMVASRCTCEPRTRLIASVSASHSCGNSCATWETGQCCWHSWSPTTGSALAEAA